MPHLALKICGCDDWVKENKVASISEAYIRATQSILDLIDVSQEHAINYLTINLFRVDEIIKYEVAEQMKIYSIFISFFVDIIDELAESRKYTLRFIGDFLSLPSELLEIISKLNAKTLNNKGMMIIFALNYSSSYEITCAINSLIKTKFMVSDFSPIKAEELEAHLSMPNIPSPNLLVYTKKEQVLDDWLPYQAKKSHVLFYDKFFPDLDREDFYKMLGHLSNKW